VRAGGAAGRLGGGIALWEDGTVGATNDARVGFLARHA
jgi:hypothetical protein